MGVCSAEEEGEDFHCAPNTSSEPSRAGLLVVLVVLSQSSVKLELDADTRGGMGVVVSSGGDEVGDDDEGSTFLLLLLLVLSCTAGDLFAPALNTKSSSQFSDGTKVYHSVPYNHHTKKGTRITSTVIMNGIHKLNGRGGMSRVGREKEGWLGLRPGRFLYRDQIMQIT